MVYEVTGRSLEKFAEFILIFANRFLWDLGLRLFEKVAILLEG